MELPADLGAALIEVLDSVDARRLASRAAALSSAYRTSAVRVRNPEDAAAYAAIRLPATFAAVTAALTQTRDRLPGWQPGSLLDAGAGPGSAARAAAAVWPEIASFTLLEREPAMIDLGKRLAARSPLAAAQWQQADLAGSWSAPRSQLVIAAYALGELPPAALEPVLARLWERTQGVLVVVEPGTPAGFGRVRRMREWLVAAGGTTIAPCPHDRACPLAAGDWCHFAQRVARSRRHRAAKGAELPYEDEKFSFTAVARTPGTPIGGRVIRHPQSRGGHIYLDLCTPDGVRRTLVTRKDRDAFHRARHLRWGSALIEP